MNWLDLLITVCIGIGLIKGLFDGIIKQVISLLSLVLAIFFAGRLAQPIREFLLKQSFVTNTFPTYILSGVCYILAFAVIVLALYWLGRLLHEAINVTPAKGMNYALGGLFGALKWVLFLSLVFNLLLLFDPNSHLISKQTRHESALLGKTTLIVPVLYPYVKEYFNLKNVQEKIIPVPDPTPKDQQKEENQENKKDKKKQKSPEKIFV